MKAYVPLKGIPLDSDFMTHAAICDNCRKVNDTPVSLGNLCLEGSILWKRKHTIKQEKPLPDQNHGTPAEVRRLMVFKL
jgi:hypothetical protein